MADIINKGYKYEHLKLYLMFSAMQMMTTFREYHAPATAERIVALLLSKAKLCMNGLADRFVEQVAVLVTTDASVVCDSH